MRHNADQDELWDKIAQRLTCALKGVEKPIADSMNGRELLPLRRTQLRVRGDTQEVTPEVGIIGPQAKLDLVW